MSAKAFSFLRAFSTTKYYQAALGGTISGASPFSFGALFALQSITGIPQQQTIFGNAVYGTSGFGLRQVATTGLLSASVGTVSQISGTTAADATNDATSQALANQFKSVENGSAVVATGPTQNFLTPRPGHVVHAVVVIDGTNQILYINGQQVQVTAQGVVTNVNPLRLGLNASAANQADALLIAGAFYHGAALNEFQVAAMFAGATEAKDIVSPAGYIVAGPVLDYIWSVKNGNPNVAATWPSIGAQTPINMVQHGTWNYGGAISDVISADMPWF